MPDKSNLFTYRVMVIIEREDNLSGDISEEAFHPLGEFDTLEEAQDLFDGIIDKETSTFSWDIPDAPSESDSDNFVDRADAFLKAL